MDKNQMQKINKTAAVIALTCVVAQELAFALFLWLAGFDFTTRRPALGLAAGFAAALAIFVFGFTFVAMVKVFTLAAAERSTEQSRNPQDCS